MARLCQVETQRLMVVQTAGSFAKETSAVSGIYLNNFKTEQNPW